MQDVTEDDNPIRRLVDSAPEIAGDAPNEERDYRLGYLPHNDFGNAQRLIARFGSDMLYVPPGGKNEVAPSGWYHWDGRRWAIDPGNCHVRTFAHRTGRAIVNEAKAHKDKGKEDENTKRCPVAALRKFAGTSGNANRVRAMITEAEPYLARSADTLDKKPCLFNVQNATLVLSNGDVIARPHSRSDLLTRCSPTVYCPDARRPVFDSFLNTILPDPLEQVFVQSYLGYSLMGDPVEEKMLLCYGSGSNGKTTLFKAVQGVFGEDEYASTLQFESLQKNDRKDGAGATPDIATLPGMRFVLAAEPEEGVRLATSTIKRMTSPDGIRARFLQKGFFGFKPEFSMTLLFNEKPIIPGQDDGTWRRIMLLRFGQQISEGNKDLHLKDKLDNERSGILNWLLDGYRIWSERGLQLPPSVLAETLEYRDDNDDVGCFVRQSIIPKDGGLITAKDLMDAYKRWCDTNGKTPWSSKKLGGAMTRMNFRRKPGGNIVYRDVDFAEWVRQDNPPSASSWSSW